MASDPLAALGWYADHANSFADQATPAILQQTPVLNSAFCVFMRVLEIQNQKRSWSNLEFEDLVLNVFYNVHGHVIGRNYILDLANQAAKIAYDKIWITKPVDRTDFVNLCRTAVDYCCPAANASDEEIFACDLGRAVVYAFCELLTLYCVDMMCKIPNALLEYSEVSAAHIDTDLSLKGLHANLLKHELEVAVLGTRTSLVDVCQAVQFRGSEWCDNFQKESLFALLTQGNPVKLDGFTSFELLEHVVVAAMQKEYGRHAAVKSARTLCYQHWHLVEFDPT
jgi:hypothetical protein